jgi:hypothetical protein
MAKRHFHRAQLLTVCFFLACILFCFSILHSDDDNYAEADDDCNNTNTDRPLVPYNHLPTTRIFQKLSSKPVHNPVYALCYFFFRVTHSLSDMKVVSAIWDGVFSGALKVGTWQFSLAVGCM